MPSTKEKIGEFLNAKSMLTPGICGAITMTITNAISVSFGVEGTTRALICLGLSFLVGTLIFAANVKRLWQKIVFYVLNSLIIFSTAAGVNLAGQAATKSETSEAPSTAIAEAQPSRGPGPTASPERVERPGPGGRPMVIGRPQPIILAPQPTNAAPATNVVRVEAVKVKTGNRFFGQWH